mgnify:CR=1 FL=1
MNTMKEFFIHLVAQPPQEYSYWMDTLLMGMHREVIRKGGILLRSNTVYELKAEETKCVLLAGYSTKWFSSAVALCRARGICPIVVSAYKPMEEGTSAVCFAMSQAIYESLQYLHDAGRRCVALVGTNPDSPADDCKQRIFLGNPGEMGMDTFGFFPCDARGMQDCIDRFVKAADQYDAVMGANDVVSVRIISALIREGYQIPEDLFVMGMGNSYIGRKLRKPLTTVAFDYDQMGRYAITLYDWMVHHTTDVSMQMTLPFELLVRATTAETPMKKTEISAVEETAGNRAYYLDPHVLKMNSIETLLQRCDAQDMRIIDGILLGYTYEQIALRTHFSERAIKYRVQRLLKQSELASRSRLCEALRDYWWVNKEGSDC